jgi:hypothetical protein
MMSTGAGLLASICAIEQAVLSPLPMPAIATYCMFLLLMVISIMKLALMVVIEKRRLDALLATDLPVIYAVVLVNVPVCYQVYQLLTNAIFTGDHSIASLQILLIGHRQFFEFTNSHIYPMMDMFNCPFLLSAPY